MSNHEAARPKRKLILSREIVHRHDSGTLAAFNDSNNTSKNTCTSAPFGMSPELPLARRP